MRAIVLDEYGGTEVLRLHNDVADPVVGPEDVLVDVVATALNRADLLQRMGFYPGPPMPREIPGMEFSGVIAELGTSVTGWSVGDTVMGIVGGGAYAERLVTHHRLLMPLPQLLPLADGAAVPEVFITAFDALVAQGGLTFGQTALVHAGASGVGTAAIQIAKALGARVIVTTSESKVDACAALGADRVVDYGAKDYVSEVLEFTDGDGVNVVLDVVGGDYVARNIDSCATDARIIQVGVMGGLDAKVPVGDLLRKRIHLLGTTLRSRPTEQKIAITQRVISEVLPRFDTGELRPVIDSRFAIEEMADAHAYMKTNANVGKILIDVMI